MLRSAIDPVEFNRSVMGPDKVNIILCYRKIWIVLIFLLATVGLVGLRSNLSSSDIKYDTESQDEDRLSG